MPINEFSTTYNNAEKYKPSVKVSEMLKEAASSDSSKQRLTSSEMDTVFKLTNRNVLGSSFRNIKYDPERDKLGRII